MTASRNNTFEPSTAASVPSDVNANNHQTVTRVMRRPTFEPQEFSRTTHELERAFEHLSNVLEFKQQTLPTPVITIQSRGRRKSLGWFVRRAWTDGCEYIPEINISAEHLERPTIDIMATPVHEMAHLSNYLAGDRDCSGHNYHNRTFKQLAERVKLICERAEDGKNQFGWAYTAPSTDLCQIVDELKVDEDVFALYRKLERVSKVPGIAWDKSQPAEPKLKKWSCGCTNVWSAVQVTAVCLKPACGGVYRRSQVFG